MSILVSFGLLLDLDVNDVLFFLLQKLSDCKLSIVLRQLFFDSSNSLPRHFLVGSGVQKEVKIDGSLIFLVVLLFLLVVFLLGQSINDLLK